MLVMLIALFYVIINWHSNFYLHASAHIKLELEWVGWTLPGVSSLFVVAAIVSCSNRENNQLSSWRHQEVPLLFCLTFRSCFFFSCMSCSNHYFNAFLCLIDTLTLCFLSFFHSFFLPVPWAIDLAVQGCKYHCGFFHSCPSTLTPLHPLYSSIQRYMHQVHLLSCWGLWCMKDFAPSCSTLHPAL